MKKLVRKILVLFLLLMPMTMQVGADTKDSSKSESYEPGSIIEDADASTLLEVNIKIGKKETTIEGFVGINASIFAKEMSDDEDVYTEKDVVDAFKYIYPGCEVIKIDGQSIVQVFDSEEVEDDLKDWVKDYKPNGDKKELDLNNLSVSLPFSKFQESANSSYSLKRYSGKNSSTHNSVSAAVRVEVEEGYKIVDNDVGELEESNVLVYRTNDYEGIEDINFVIKSDSMNVMMILLIVGGVLLLIIIIIVIVVLVRKSRRNTPQYPNGGVPMSPYPNNMGPNNGAPVFNQNQQMVYPNAVRQQTTLNQQPQTQVSQQQSVQPNTNQPINHGPIQNGQFSGQGKSVQTPVTNQQAANVNSVVSNQVGQTTSVPNQKEPQVGGPINHNNQSPNSFNAKNQPLNNTGGHPNQGNPVPFNQQPINSGINNQPRQMQTPNTGENNNWQK